MSDPIDTGSGHRISFYGWHPDRDLNPQYVDRPDIDRVGIRIEHPRPDSEGECVGAVTFEQPGAEMFSDKRWVVEQWEPLTISPSVLCLRCGDHGFIRGGRWEAA